jgi:hypothetical protein
MSKNSAYTFPALVIGGAILTAGSLYLGYNFLTSSKKKYKGGHLKILYLA